MNSLVDEIKRSDRKSIAIVVSADGKVLVRAPRFATNAMIEKFVASKKEWIVSTRDKALAKRSHLPTSNAFDDGILLFGERVKVNRSKNKTASFDHRTNEFKFPELSASDSKQILEKLYKKIARDHLSSRLGVLANQLGYTVKTFRLSSARTRWGSCSSKGTISLNWKLIMAPRPVIDYVIAHELSHFDHMNHSKAFWDKVKMNFPGYERHRTWLKKNGKTLTLEGIQFK